MSSGMWAEKYRPQTLDDIVNQREIVTRLKTFVKEKNLPEPICFNGSFLFWAPDSLNINSLIYVNDDTSEISYYFHNVQKVGGITNIYARESGLPVFLCQGPRNNFEEFYQNKVKVLKDNYRSKPLI